MDADTTSSNTSMPNHIKSVYEPLYQEVSGLHAKWKLFRQLFAHSEERIALLQKTTPGFFGLIQFVLLDDISLSISRLTDPLKSVGKANLSLQRLIEFIDPDGDPDFHANVQKAFDELQVHCSPFRAQRNRRIAHKDLQTALDVHPEPLPQVDGKRIEEALLMIATFMNQIQGHFEDAETAYDHVSLMGDADDLVFFLSQAVEYHEAKSKRLRG